MKALASILTAAVVLIGAEVLVKSSKAPAQPTDATQFAAGTLALHGGSGMPPLPPDAF